MINSETGCEWEVINALRKLPGVKEAHLVQGSYDIIACIEAESMEEIKNILSWKIRRLNRIRATRTAIIA